MRKLLPALALSLLAFPSAAQNLSSGEGDWSNIPQLRKNGVVMLDPTAQARVDQAVIAGKCKMIGNRHHIKMALPFLVEFGPGDSVASILVKRIGCPEVESIAASAALRSAQSGDIRHTGENAAGWYRGEISYVVQFSG